MFKKSFWLLLILIIFVLSGCFQKNRPTDLYESILKNNKMIVGISFESKPFGFKDNDGKIKGFEVDLAREIAQRILGDKNNVEFKNINSQDRTKAADSGSVDMIISTMTITNERKKLVKFSVPYFIAGQAICVKKDSKIDSYEDLNNKKVVVILGTTGEKNIEQFVPNALIQGYENHTDALDAFKNDSYDAITTDDSLLQGFIIDNSDYIILPERLTKEPYGIAFKKSKHSNSLKKIIDEILNEIKYDGTLDNIKEKWGIS